MTREEIKQEVISLSSNQLLLELGTGTGKSRMAIEKIKSWSNNKKKTLLIVVPRNVLKENWKAEIKKWWIHCNLDITYTTYVSLPKYKGKWDYVIMDECHHLSERCRKSLNDFSISYIILLSATVNKNLKEEFKKLFPSLYIYKKSLREVIDNNILPDPKVFLWPLELDNTKNTEVIWFNKNTKGPVKECTWIQRWHYIKQFPNCPIKVKCTEKQYILKINENIDFWKKRYLTRRQEIAKNKWLKLCGERLKWLSDKKLKYVFQLLSILKNHRTLTFCNSIEQTELLGKYCINSKSKSSMYNLDLFNRGKIKHITACNMLNEGMNLINCKVGIYANLNSSETIVKQRLGRVLRHKNPIIIVPFFKNTRDEELKNKMLEDYNPELITVMETIKELVI